MIESVFCPGPLWDWDLTWALNNRTFSPDYYGPDFTDCFQRTVLVWIPCAFLWLLGAPFEILSHWGRNGSPNQVRVWTKLNTAKLLLGVVLVVVHVFLLQLKTPKYTGPIWSQLLRVVTLILAEFLLIHGKYVGIRSSGPQFIFWTLATAGEIFPFRATVLKLTQGLVSVQTGEVVQLMVLPLTVATLFLNCWADNEGLGTKKGQPPEATASFLSHILFAWVEPLLFKGYRTPLDFPDLWELSPEDTAHGHMVKFEAYWNRKRWTWTRERSRRGSRYSRSRHGSAQSKGGTKIRVPRDPSLFRALWHVFGGTFLVGASFKIVQDCLLFIAPQILSLLVAFVDNGEETWKGVTYVFLLLIGSILQSIFLGQYFHRMFQIGMQVKVTIMSAIYRKALVISNAARKESTVGEIVNLMSVDAQNINDLIPFVNLLWSSPFQIGLALYFLWQTLGWSVMAGVALLACIVPLNAFISSRVKRLQMDQMRVKDQRVKLMSEILSGIKVYKMYAWEPSLQAEVLRIRDKEMDILKISVYLECVMSFVMHCAPFLVALFTAGTYIMVDRSHVFDASKAFVSLTLFTIMRTPLKMLPMVISNTIKASVSLKRISDFLNSEEIPAEGAASGVTHMPNVEYPIVIQNATFAWEEDAEVLRNVNLHVRQGSLVALVGPVGSGKSSLLAAILGELPHGSERGHVNTLGSIAYVAQQAWIQGASLQENILFGRPLEPERYQAVLEACALLPDLAILPAGDQTEIGEKGINLSGGQKQRVALARAAYSDADVYLLDDPFSALDSHVGRHVFDNLVGPKGMLREKTRVLVTHGLAFLPAMDRIIVLCDGEIAETGSYDELLAQKGDFAEFLMDHVTSRVETNPQNASEEEVMLIKELHARLESIPRDSQPQVRPRRLSRAISGISAAFSTASTTVGGGARARRHSRVDSGSSSVMSTPQRIRPSPGYVMEPLLVYSPDSDDGPTSAPPSASRKGSEAGIETAPEGSTLVRQEVAEIGSVKTGVYLFYIRSVGVLLFALTVFSQFISQAFEISSNVWLAQWTGSSNAGPPDNEGNSTTGGRIQSLGIYACLGLGQAVFLVIGAVAMAQGLSNASGFLHHEMLARILRSPMHFFDQTPAGRIVNRFGKDVDVVDSVLPHNFRDFLFCICNVASTLIVMCYAIPAFVVVLVPVSLLYYLVQRYYVESSRQLKRMEAVSRSPIFSHFQETVTGAGLATIRATRSQPRFTAEFEAKVDRNNAAHHPFIIANRWLSIRLEFIANLIIFSSALLAVLLVDRMDAGFVGLAVAYSLQITSTLNWVVRMTAALETNIVAVERIKEYTQVPQEAPYEAVEEGDKPNEKWPEKGVIEFRNFGARYREGLDLVLRDLTCRIGAGEKIGIVGRTGAGKSTLTLALFRIIEPATGSIYIDGMDISRLGLFDLRSRLTIIPQDPVLFSGTLRLNLDPFTTHSDGELWQAFELANLKHFVKGLQGGLRYEISEGGENLSVGQRQQICLARALLRRTRILVLDEATASVDLETDNLIQRTIREEFANATVLTIAHRLNTIMDSTRVLVLEQGTIKEFETPAALLKNPESVFYGMARDAGLA